MIPPSIRLAIFIATGMAVVWLLARWWQSALRHRAARKAALRSVPRQTHAVAEPVTPVVPSVSTDVPSVTELPPVVAPSPTLSILKPGVQLGTTGALTPAASTAAIPPAAIVQATAPVSATTESQAGWSPPRWADRPLLQQPKEAGALPKVLAQDVPVSRTDDYFFGGATPVLAAFLPESPRRLEESRQELERAGYYQPHSLQNFAAVRYVLIMLGLVIAGVALLLVPPRWEWIAMGALLILPLLGWALPRLYLRGQAAERRSEIERGMPDLLDMLNMCVSQGLTIPDALRRILPDLRGPYPALAQELRIVNDQASIGGMRTALENFSSRLDIPEVHSFTSLMTQTEKMGTSISDALASYSDSMRESLKQRAEERGNRATFQILFPTVLCLMPAVYLFLLGPAIIELSNFFAAGGRDSLDRGSAVIERINASRNARTPLDQ